MPFNEGNVSAPHTRYTMKTRYCTDLGILQMAIAGPAGSGASVIQAAAPFGWKIAEWAAERIGARPQLPDPEPETSGHFLKYREISPESRTPSIDGKDLHRITGVYTYLLTQPLGDADTLKGPALPPELDTTPPVAVTVPPGDYVSGLI